VPEETRIGSDARSAREATLNEYLLGQLLGAATPPALIAFFVLRKRTPGVVPYLVAVGAGLAGMGGILAFNALTHRLGTSDADIQKLEASYNKGCVPGCTRTGAAEPLCRSICACVLTRLHARYPSNESFARWFRSADTSADSVKKEVIELSTSCAQAGR
jgi:hypothetical protein